MLLVRRTSAPSLAARATIGLLLLLLAPSVWAGVDNSRQPGSRTNLEPAWSQPANIHPAVARIVAPGQGSISYGSGTLVYVQDDWGIVVTNWHVINEATGQISVHFPDGFYSLGSVRAADRDWDLAAIAIRRPPNLEPVKLADAAPRPGDTLTIAGYGSGNYRAATGRCTQYVAPGTTFPYEMVEVSVSARQGDSGGPIFNSQGELAGVLFGEGHGRTAGSYCGRVKWFLSSVAPSMRSVSDIASAPGHPGAQLHSLPTAGPLRAVPAQPGAVVASANDSPRWSGGPSPKNPFVANRSPTTPGRVSTEATPSHFAAPASIESQHITWQDFAGDTLGEQIKTVFAVLGVLALLLHVLAWLGK